MLTVTVALVFLGIIAEVGVGLLQYSKTRRRLVSYLKRRYNSNMMMAVAAIFATIVVVILMASARGQYLLKATINDLEAVGTSALYAPIALMFFYGAMWLCTLGVLFVVGYSVGYFRRKRLIFELVRDGELDYKDCE